MIAKPTLRFESPDRSNHTAKVQIDGHSTMNAIMAVALTARKLHVNSQHEILSASTSGYRRR